MGGNVSRLGNIFEDVAAKAPVRAATTANIALSGLQTIDGVALADGDRVLVKSQTDQTQNGIYQASTGNWMRSFDGSKNTDFVNGTFVLVTLGAVNAGQLFQQTCTDAPIVIGTSHIAFAAFGTILVLRPQFIGTSLTFLDVNGNQLVAPVNLLGQQGAAGSAQNFPTRAAVAVAVVNTTLSSIIVERYAAGLPLAPARYVQGTSGGPAALQDAGGTWWQIDTSGGEVNALWFGLDGGGVNDNATKWSAWLNAAVGKKAILPLPASGYLTTATVTIPSGTTLIGGGGTRESAAAIVASGTACKPLVFIADDASNVTIRGIKFQGNYSAVLAGTPNSIGALQFRQVAAAMHDIVIEDNVFTGFNDSYVIHSSITGTQAIKRCTVRRNEVITDATSYIDNASYGHYAVNFFGSDSSAGGRYEQLKVTENYIDATGTCIGIAFWNNHLSSQCWQNEIINAGASDTTLFNYYGLLAYDNSGNFPTTVSFIDNIITNCRACGIYGADAGELVITGNKISGCSSTDDSTLPRAAIALNYCNPCLVADNELLNNWGGVAIVNCFDKRPMQVVDNLIYSASGSTGVYGVRLQPPTGSLLNVLVKGNDIDLLSASSVGIRSASSVSAQFLYVEVADNTFNVGLRSVSFNSGYFGEKLVMKGNVYRGTDSVAAVDVGGVTGVVVVRDETFDLVNISGNGLVGTSSLSLVLKGLTFMNKSSGSPALSLAGAHGSMEGIQFNDVGGAYQVAAGSLGTAPPTWSGFPGMFVQCITTDAYTQAGTAGSQYTVMGWVCNSGTTWLPRRSLDGN